MEKVFVSFCLHALAHARSPTQCHRVARGGGGGRHLIRLRDREVLWRRRGPPLARLAVGKDHVDGHSALGAVLAPRLHGTAQEAHEAGVADG